MDSQEARHFVLRAKMGLVIAVALHMACNLIFYEQREEFGWRWFQNVCPIASYCYFCTTTCLLNLLVLEYLSTTSYY
jgi:hypothetical protein